MIGAIVHQLTKNLTEEEIMKGGFADYFVDHTLGIYPLAASGTPFTAAYIAVKGDTIADLTEDLAADAAIVQQQQQGGQTLFCCYSADNAERMPRRIHQNRPIF